MVTTTASSWNSGGTVPVGGGGGVVGGGAVVGVTVHAGKKNKQEVSYPKALLTAHSCVCTLLIAVFTIALKL